MACLARSRVSNTAKLSRTMQDDNLFTALRAVLPTDLDTLAIETADTPQPLRYTWRDLERGTAMLANLLESLDLPAGSRVAAQTDKSVEALMLYLAVLRAGFVYLPLNNAYRHAEIAYFLGDAEPAVMVCTKRDFGWISKLAFQAGTHHVFTLDGDRSGSLLERASRMSDVHTPQAKAAGDLAAILYTSGTTGRSKGAMLSHGNLLSNARGLKDHWRWRSDDVLIHALPMFHVHGLFVASHSALLSGSRMIWFARFDPAAVIARLPQATVFMGVPTMYVRLLGEPALDAQACRGMRLFVSGSAPMLLDTFDAWRQRTRHIILERYGMSETLMLTSNPCDPADGPRRGGSVGRPLPGVGLRIRADDGRDCGAAEVGSIEVRGPNVFSGYWRMPEKTAQEFVADASGAWFKTGDLGQRDAEGYISIVGRSKDLIISGGYNVYPAELEGYLNQWPGVAESAVIGVPHPDFGEGVLAVVVGQSGAIIDPAAVIADLKQHIAGYKVPKRIQVVDELPRNAMGKVQKNLLRDRYRALFA